MPAVNLGGAGVVVSGRLAALPAHVKLRRDDAILWRETVYPAGPVVFTLKDEEFRAVLPPGVYMLRARESSWRLVVPEVDAVDLAELIRAATPEAPSA